MHLSGDHRRFPSATGDGGAVISYSSYNLQHHYPYDGAVNMSKRMKLGAHTESVSMPQQQETPHDSTGPKRSEDPEPVMSRDEIERCSPSRKDGIDRYMETHLRYSYCAYLQILGLRLHLPQTTVGTAMVLCHRFFLRRSHASNDRFLIATAALFLASKSEETPCLLNSVISASFKICQKQDFAFPPQLLYNDRLELCRDQVVEAEQLILTTLDFDLEMEHPHVPLTSVLNKLGLSQTVLLNLAWNLVNEGVFLHETNVLNLCDILSWRIYMLTVQSMFYASQVVQLAASI